MANYWLRRLFEIDTPFHDPVHPREKSLWFDCIVSDPPVDRVTNWSYRTALIQSSGLFLQQVIAYLKVGGTAAIALPTPLKISNSVRWLFLHCCELKRVVFVQEKSKVALLFTKRRDEEEVVTVEKENRGVYIQMHPVDPVTKTVLFSRLGEESERSVTIEQMKNKGFSLLIDDYMNKVEKTIGDICSLRTGKKVKEHGKKEHGNYLLIGNGHYPMGMHSRSNVSQGTTLISRNGDVSRYDVPVYATDDVVYVVPGLEVDVDFLHYYLKYTLYKSLCRVDWNTKDRLEQIERLKISVPSMKEQIEIADRIGKEEERLTKQVTTKQREVAAIEKELVDCSTLFTGALVPLTSISTVGKPTNSSISITREGLVFRYDGVPRPSIVTAMAGKVDSDYLLCALCCRGRKELSGPKALRRIKIPLPEMSVQLSIVKKIGGRVKSLSERMNDAEKTIAQLRAEWKKVM